MPINVGDSLADSHVVTGSLELSGSLFLTSLQSSYDLVGGFPFVVTQNVRKGQLTLTTNGSVADNGFFYVVVSSNQISQTDAFALSVASSSISVNTGLTLKAEAVQDGFAAITVVNNTGGTLADDTKVIVNWAAI